MHQNLNILYLFILINKKNDIKEINKQITKVAIGKPGGASFDEEWELSYSLYCLECGINIDDPDFE